MCNLARTLGLRLLLSNATTESEITAAFATLVERQAGAVFVGGSVQLAPRYDQIISLAARPMRYPRCLSLVISRGREVF